MGKQKTMGRGVGLQALISAIVVLSLSSCGGGGGSGDSSSNNPNLVATDKGLVQGTEKANMRQFLGIPYAAPPVGDLRWKPPQPADAWREPKNVDRYASFCAQGPNPFNATSTAEDCLYLNVFTPKGGGPFPVMVWIYGGGLTSGLSDVYDPTALVDQGVTVVTFNYRLGPLGFLAHPALSAEGGGTSGNYGLMDQQAALRWVKTNIAGFGGDPNNVTLFGVSAGGLSTHLHMTSPSATGLFHKAIVGSGAYSYTIALPVLADAQNMGRAFASQAGCTDQSLACLRSLPVSKILEHTAATQVMGQTLPTVDGKLLPLSLDEAFSTGRFAKIPLIEGTTKDEYSLLSGLSVDPALGRPLGAVEYPNFVANLFGTDLAPTILNAYPLNTIETPAQTFDNVATDAVFACNARKVAKLFAANGLPVYTYEFADPNPPLILDLPPRPEGYGTYHASDFQYIFPRNGTDSDPLGFFGPFPALVFGVR